MKILFFGVLGVSLAILAYLFFQPSEEKLYGRALVLAFTDADTAHNTNLPLWNKLDLSVRVDESCKQATVEKISQCVTKKINKALSQTQSEKKHLIVLAEKKYTSALLFSLNNIDVKQIAAVVLMNPEFDGLDFASYSFKSLDKMLVVNDLNSSKENLILVRQLTNQLRLQNIWLWSTQLLDNGAGLFYHPVLPHMVSYLVEGPINPNYKVEFDAESLWQHPRVNNDDFWQQRQFIEKRDVTNDIRRVLNAFYAYDTSYVRQWSLQSYHAFNILKYRDSLPSESQGRYLNFTNLKGHNFYLDLDKYGAYTPELVIGIDDETNLYKLTSFYKTRKFYSWEPGGPNEDMLYSQSLGAFIHFQTPLPSDEELPYLQYSSILFDSIRFTDKDPYAHINGLSHKAFKVITMNCLPCHNVDGVGGAAHHLDYRTVQPQPGFAKPLLSYSHSVLDNFFFNQTNTAQLIGVNPNYVEHEVGKELIAWLQGHENYQH